MTYSAEELRKATCNFAASYRLGTGSFGEVYHAQLRCSDVAVKILKKVLCHCALKSDQHEIITMLLLIFAGCCVK